LVPAQINSAAPAVDTDKITRLDGLIFYCGVFVGFINFQFTETDDTDLVKLWNGYGGMGRTAAFCRQQSSTCSRTPTSSGTVSGRTRIRGVWGSSLRNRLISVSE